MTPTHQMSSHPNYQGGATKTKAKAGKKSFTELRSFTKDASKERFHVKGQSRSEEKSSTFSPKKFFTKGSCSETEG